jgi:hypothetical protein
MRFGVKHYDVCPDCKRGIAKTIISQIGYSKKKLKTEDDGA